MHKKNDELKLDFVYLLLALPWNYLCAVFIIQPLFWPENAHQIIPTSMWMLVANVAILLLSGDLLMYWIHRTSHRWLPLWRLHAVHHSSVHVHSISTIRIHPLSDLLFRVVFALPAAVLPIDATSAGVAGFIFLGQQFLTHSTIRMPKFVSWVFITPQLHRWHHGCEADQQGGNFAFMFSFIDRVFGTLRFTMTDPDEFGLPDDESRRVGRTFARQLVSPLVSETAETEAIRNAGVIDADG